MKWPWKRSDDVALDEAREAREGAVERLKEARARRPEVLRRAQWARNRREVNHLTELFDAIHRGSA